MQNVAKRLRESIALATQRYKNSRTLPIALITIFVVFLIWYFASLLSKSDKLALRPNTTKQQSISPSFTPLLRQKLDQLITEKIGTQAGAGYAIEVIENGQIVYRKCSGYADIKTKRPVTAKTIFGLASLTKTFTAIALLRLVDEGKIDLDKPIDTYMTGIPQDWRDITVAQLANMTAGFPRDLKTVMPWKEQYKMMKEQSLLYKTGTKHYYSNLSYNLLGQIIENVSGQSYLSYIRTVILNPTGMKSTGSIDDVISTGLLAIPYQTTNQGLNEASYRIALNSYAAGMLFSNLDDLANYAKTLLDRKILSSNSYQIMWSKRSTLADGTFCYWAFGWGNKSFEEHRQSLVVSMNGELPGIATNLILYPNVNVAIISLSNLDSSLTIGITHDLSQLILP